MLTAYVYNLLPIFLSNKPVYTFYVPGDISLKAVYNDSENSAKEIVVNSAVQKQLRADGKYNLYYLGEINAPQNATIDAVGIVYTDTEDKVGSLNTTVADIKNRIAVAEITNKLQSGPIMVVLNGVSSERYRYAKLYVTYTLNGQSYTVYSDAVAIGSTY